MYHFSRLFRLNFEVKSPFSLLKLMQYDIYLRLHETEVKKSTTIDYYLVK